MPAFLFLHQKVVQVDRQPEVYLHFVLPGQMIHVLYPGVHPFRVLRKYHLVVRGIRAVSAASIELVSRGDGD